MTEQEVERLINHKLERFRTHPEWLDIQQEARIAAWKALERTRDKPWAPSTVVCKAAAWAAADYLRAKRSNSYRRYNPEWQPPLSLEIRRHPEDEDGLGETLVATEQWSRLIWKCAELCEAVFPKLPVRHVRLFVRHYFAEVKQVDLAREEGVTWSRIQQILSLCRNAFRREMDLPESGYSKAVERERERRRARCPARRAKVQAYQRALYARRRAEGKKR